MKDWRGVPIEVGSLVVYPVRRGSSMWLVEGVVHSLHPAQNPDAASYWERDEDWVEVQRRRELYYGKLDEVDPKLVRVGLRLLTVLEPPRHEEGLR